MIEEFAFDNTEERRKTRQNGTGWIEVIVGSEFAKIDDKRYTIRNCADDYTRLFSELKGSGWTQAVHLLARPVSAQIRSKDRSGADAIRARKSSSVISSQ